MSSLELYYNQEAITTDCSTELTARCYTVQVYERKTDKPNTHHPLCYKQATKLLYPCKELQKR